MDEYHSHFEFTVFSEYRRYYESFLSDQKKKNKEEKF